MLLIIDNTKRKLREKLRAAYLKNGIPCALTDMKHAADFLPCAMIQVTERYLYDDAVFLASMYGKIPVTVSENVEAVGIVSVPHIRMFPRGVCYCSKNLYLTKTERLIVNMLLLYDADRVPIPLAALYCMKVPKPASLCVHVCNINAKAKRATGIDLIDCRRYSGYCLHKFES